MRLAFLIGSINMGGLEKVAIQLINALSSEYDIDLIVLYENDNFYPVNHSVNIITGHIKYNSVEKFCRKITNLKRKVFSIYLQKEIDYVLNIVKYGDYDKIIAVDGMNAMILHTVKQLLNDSLDIKMISWLHNNYDTYFNNYYNKFQCELREALSASDYVVTLTNNDRKNYGQYNPNTVTIYNPITISKTFPSNLMNKEIVFVARLVREHKGLDYLIEIGKKLKGSGWIIRIVGDGNDGKWFEEQVKSHQLTDVFQLEGSISDNIERYYEQASIFISTSKWEGLPLVMIEAISSGLPVISFNHTGAIEILGNNEHGILIEMGDVDLFYEYLQTLMNSYERRLDYSKRSLKRSEDFKSEVILSQWERILK